MSAADIRAWHEEYLRLCDEEMAAVVSDFQTLQSRWLGELEARTGLAVGVDVGSGVVQACCWG